MRNFFLITLLFLAFLYQSYAFMIQPPKMELAFEPGKTVEFGYAMGGYRGEGNLSLRIYAIGDLNTSIVLNTNSTTLNPGEWKAFSFQIAYPSLLNPGIHTNGIVIEEEGNPGEGVAAVSGIIIPLYIQVPYPGKYLDVRLEASDTPVDRDVPLTLHLTSKGSEDLESVSGVLSFHNTHNTFLENLTLASFSMQAMDQKEMLFSWDPQNDSAGSYYAIATIFYDGNMKQAQASFKIGEAFIEIVSINGTRLLKDQIGKIDVELANKWNSIIPDAYLEIEVYDTKGNSIKKSRTETFSIASWQTSIISSYLDVHGLDVATYSGKATVFYGPKTTSKKFSLAIYEISKSTISTIHVLIVLVIILSIFLLLALRKRKENKS